MARISDPTPEQEAEWKEWTASRPAHVRAVVERFDPWSLYRMKSTGHRVPLVSFDEYQSGRVTVTVAVLGRFNQVLHERRVFGIDPDDLEPCELPGPDEAVGSAMSQEEVENNLDVLRVKIRPDLWEMGADGKARRKP